MRKNIILAILLLLAAVLTGGLYLNRSYAHIYNFIAQQKLIAPSMPKTITFPPVPNLADPKPTIRYAAIGDSLTAGTGADDYRDSFPYLLAQKFSRTGPVELANFAVPGAQANDVLKYQLPKAIAFDPEYITLLIGINDIHNQTGLSNYRSNLARILNELKEKTKAKVVVLNLPFLGTNDLLLPPYYFYFQEQTEKFNKTIGEISGQKPLCLFDLYTPTAPQKTNNFNYYAADHFHPSAEGYRLWADLIYADPDCRPD